MFRNSPDGSTTTPVCFHPKQPPAWSRNWPRSNVSQSTQIVVLTIPSLQGDDIDQFTIRVADQWKIGQKGSDNGVLLVLAQAERKVRIEVGMGLQGVLPDITAGRIIRDVMRPHLKSGNFDHGIDAGVDGIIAATKGEFKAPPESARAGRVTAEHPPC